MVATEPKQCGTYICHLCGRRWRWLREPVTDYVLSCPDCSNGKQVVLDYVPDGSGDADDDA